MANSHEISSLGNTTWSVITSPNITATFKFKNDNTVSYTTNVDPTVDFFWWQKGNSFWMQPIKDTKGYFSLIEGKLSSNTKGSGKIIVGKQGNDGIYITEYTMTKNS